MYAPPATASPLSSSSPPRKGLLIGRDAADWEVIQPLLDAGKMPLLARFSGLEQHPEKTFIGRVSRGFDFLGVDFQPGAPLAPSAVSPARQPEKTARLHEQGASPERIGRYRQHWQRHLRGIPGGPAAPAPTPPPPGGPTPPPAAPRAPVLSSRHPSLRPRCSRA